MVLLISTSPLTIGALLSFYIDQKSSSYFTSLGQSAERGELFLYSMSVIGTIFWLANKAWIAELEAVSEKRLLPPKMWFNLWSIFAFGICSVFFGIDYVRFKVGHELLSLSFTIFVVSILAWYVLIVLSEVAAPDYDAKVSSETQSLRDRLRKLRSGNGA